MPLFRLECDDLHPLKLARSAVARPISSGGMNRKQCDDSVFREPSGPQSHAALGQRIPGVDRLINDQGHTVACRAKDHLRFLVGCGFLFRTDRDRIDIRIALFFKVRAQERSEI